MNRLSPLINRRREAIRRAAMPVATASLAFAESYEPARWLEDLRLFATAWGGGLVFFGTLLG
jgi:hypothetical protein